MIVINPKTKNLLFSDIASSLAHLVLLLFLIFSTPNLTDAKKISYRLYFEPVCYTLIGLIVFRGATGAACAPKPGKTPITELKCGF